MVIVLIVIGLAWAVLAMILVLHRPSRERAGPAMRLIPDVVRLVRAVLADDETPASVKVALAGLLIYLISPIDVIPDFLPVIGSIDDVIVTGLVLRWAGRRVGVTGLAAHWSGDAAGFELLRGLLAM